MIVWCRFFLSIFLPFSKWAWENDYYFCNRSLKLIHSRGSTKGVEDGRGQSPDPGPCVGSGVGSTTFSPSDLMKIALLILFHWRTTKCIPTLVRERVVLYNGEWRREAAGVGAGEGWTWSVELHGSQRPWHPILFPSVDLKCSQKVCVLTELTVILHPPASLILANKGVLSILWGFCVETRKAVLLASPLTPYAARRQAQPAVLCLLWGTPVVTATPPSCHLLRDSLVSPLT